MSKSLNLGFVDFFYYAESRSARKGPAQSR